MSKRNEDSVEKFFRKAAAQYDKTFIEKDWQKMEKLLDADATQRSAMQSGKLKRAAMTGTGITGIIIILYFLVFDHSHPESRLIAGDVIKQKQAAAGAKAPVHQQKTEKNPSAALFSQSDDQAISSNIKTQFAKHARLNKQSKSVRLIDIRQNIPPLKDPDGGTTTGSDTELSDKSQSELRDKTQGTSLVNQSQSTNETFTRTNSNSISVESKSIQGSENDKVTEEEKQMAIEESQVAITEQVSSPKKEQNLLTSKWNIALAIAPDFSTTQLTRYSSPGQAFGLEVGYQISRRFMVTTGMLKTYKKYTGYGEEYQPPTGYWQRRTNGVVPEEIEGNCSVIEIPVQLQYTLAQREKSRLFVSAGISSYLMRQESYKYFFESPNPGAASGWSSKEPSSYAFSIGDLSVGYERNLSPRFAIGVEPFLKVPFSGIGWSKIDLYTTGAYVNLRYRILRKGQIGLKEETKNLK